MKQALTVVVAAAALMSASPAVAADLPASLVDPYLQVHAALAGDQFTGVTAHAQAIASAAGTLGKDAEAIVTGAKTLAAAKDIAAARTAFGDLSASIAAYAEKTKSGFGPGVKLAFCPMANKPWLQKDKEIKNPFYGAAMSTCGSFKN